MEQRIIKYRIWSKSLQKWVTDLFLENIVDCRCCTVDDLFRISSDAIIYQQFTGLKDSQGKEMYEGDICNRKNWTGNPYYIKYSKDGWFWCGTKESQTEFLQHRDCLYDADRLRNGIEECKIIGNILENPELLK